MRREQNERHRRGKRTRFTSIPDPNPRDEEKIRFSFEHIDLDSDLFGPQLCTQEFWEALMRTLKEYETMAVDDFTNEDHTYARHGIEFAKTNMPDGFNNVDTEQLSPFRFAVGERKLGWRVHGFIARKRFYIVWLDKDHVLKDNVK